MDSNKKTVRIVGVLFLVQMIAAVVSYSVILEPILYGGNFLVDVSANAVQVKMAMLFDLICSVSIVAIAILLHPILKNYNERIALWYVGLRVIECVTIVASGVFLLSLVSLSTEFVQAGTQEASNFQVLGNWVLSTRGWAQNMTIIVYCIGACTFYYLLFKARLVPRFISVWGLIAVTILFTEIMLITFGDTLRMILMMPMGLNEVFLGIWLITKGFNLSQSKQRVIGGAIVKEMG